MYANSSLNIEKMSQFLSAQYCRTQDTITI